jgi:release factor glutamine methyltransferase
MAVLRRAATGAARFLRPGGALLLELGGDEAEGLAPDLARLGYGDTEVLRDEDGDVRGISSTWPGRG